jgi:hypothetical protein
MIINILIQHNRTLKHGCHGCCCLLPPTVRLLMVACLLPHAPCCLLLHAFLKPLACTCLPDAVAHGRTRARCGSHSRTGRRSCLPTQLPPLALAPPTAVLAHAPAVAHAHSTCCRAGPRARRQLARVRPALARASRSVWMCLGLELIPSG